MLGGIASFSDKAKQTLRENESSPFNTKLLDDLNGIWNYTSNLLVGFQALKTK